MKAKAVVFTDKLQVEVLEVDVPELGPDQVLIDVDYSWISIGTESSFLREERSDGETPYREGDPSIYPMVAGYQKTGIVRAVGADVQGLAVGDHVFATMSFIAGMKGPMGGHVSPAVTPADQVWKLPEGADPVAYAGMVLTQVGYNCGIRPDVKAGDFGVVIGDGLVGQWAAHTLAHRGVHVALLGRHDERLGYLPGEIRKINTRNISSIEGLMELKAGDSEGLLKHGINVIVDSVGDLDSVNVLMPQMRREGHLVAAGFYGDRDKISIQQLRPKEITLHCPSGWSKMRMDATLKGIEEGWLLTEPLVTHRFPVDQAKQAWDVILDRNQQCLGVILEW